MIFKIYKFYKYKSRNKIKLKLLIVKINCLYLIYKKPKFLKIMMTLLLFIKNIWSKIFKKVIIESRMTINKIN
jgi:hypothetical protein